MQIKDLLRSLKRKGVSAKLADGALRVSNIPSWKDYVEVMDNIDPLLLVATAKQVFSTPGEPMRPIERPEGSRGCSWCQYMHLYTCDHPDSQYNERFRTPARVFQTGCHLWQETEVYF